MTDCDYFVPTKACRSRPSKEYVVVEGPPKREKSVKDKDIASVDKAAKKKVEDVPKSVRDILKMKHASKMEQMKEMFEIFKYTKSEMSGAEKLKADKDLIVKLGGVAPKNKYKNYKELIIEVKQQKEQEKLLREQAKLGGRDLLEQLEKKRKPRENDAKKRRIDDKKGAVSGMISQFGKVNKSQLKELKKGKSNGSSAKKSGKTNKAKGRRK